MANLILANQPSPGRRTVAKEISDRLSEELVIALVGPVGSGVSTTSSYISELLKHTFSYNVCPTIKVSTIIKAEAHRVGSSSIAQSPSDEYITIMQTAGNQPREKFGGHYLAEKAVEKIYKFRHENGGYSGDSITRTKSVYNRLLKKSRRVRSSSSDLWRDTMCIWSICSGFD
jgi:ABC-type glutathione transport system ATPase component